jgi:hypothetical protein
MIVLVVPGGILSQGSGFFCPDSPSADLGVFRQHRPLVLRLPDKSVKKLFYPLSELRT